MDMRAEHKRNARWPQILQTWIAGIAIGCATLLVIDNALLQSEVSPITLVIAALMIFAVPLSILAHMQQTRIAQLRESLEHAETHDILTGSIKGQIFVSEIDRRAHLPAGERLQGAMLIVEAAHARSLHLRLGQGGGEEPVKLIADAIRSAVRSTDMIGRLDIHTFGVFLPTATENDAKAIGERIRKAVARVYMAPDGQDLRISIAGVVCDRMASFDTMFRAVADLMETTEHNAIESVAIAALPAPTPAALERRVN